MIEGNEKIGQTAAALMDYLESCLSEADSIQIDEVLIAVELTYTDAEDEEWSRVQLKSSNRSPVYQRGIITAAAQVIDAGVDYENDE